MRMWETRFQPAIAKLTAAAIWMKIPSLPSAIGLNFTNLKKDPQIGHLNMVPQEFDSKAEAHGTEEQRGYDPWMVEIHRINRPTKKQETHRSVAVKNVVVKPVTSNGKKETTISFNCQSDTL